MKEARFNPTALANGAPRKQQQAIRTVDLGEGWGLVGFELVPAQSEDGTKMAAMLAAVCCKQSLIAPIDKFHQVMIAPIGEFEVAKLVEALKALGAEKKAEDA